ncbi:MAG: molybdopterin molybdotransferase MoeA [Synergistaceae bacterium]|jgi:molybdopterin molybdotransferase/putative molybdopterin biosynthesis protein|nr:molybdopterin molybdotransferase MoeA [Synergistaceae bacterium]
MNQIDDPSGHMPIDEIMEKLRANWIPDPGCESESVDDALGRVPARDVLSLMDIPVHRGAECDGIAVRSSDFADGAPDVSSWVLGTDFAMVDMGDDFDDMFDAVIPIENVDLSGGKLALLGASVAPGRLVEPKGGTVREGEVLARRGARLSSIDIANLTTAGITRVSVLKRPKVAFIPTGGELVPAGSRPSRGQVIDCDSAMARTLLGPRGAEVVPFPVVNDVRRDLEGILDQAMSSCDIVLVSGGSSKGTEDLCPRLIERDAVFFSHYVRARPGRPIAVAIKDGKAVVNIPGPAFSAYFALQWCVCGLIEHWFGLYGTPRPVISARAKNGLALDRLPLAYGLFFEVSTESGVAVATALDESRRGELFMRANAFTILPIGSPGFMAGDTLSLYPID